MTIIVKILGGMGNQMFQYAAAKSLAIDLNSELLLDTESLQRHAERHYDLGHFNIQEKLTTKSDFKKIGYSFLSYPLVRLKKHPHYYVEEKFTYNESLKNMRIPIYLDGYFQTEKYFSKNESAIRDCFNFRIEKNFNELKFIEKITSSNAVSIHVRRGDYISNPKANVQMGILGLDYYQNAMKILEDKINTPTYFVFSDDEEWVKANLKINKPCYFVTGNSGKEGFRDMRLMSQCQHHIIANSSFSWWGAWLNSDRGKMVIAPKIWFRDGTVDSDLLPANWLRI